MKNAYYHTITTGTRGEAAYMLARFDSTLELIELIAKDRREKSTVYYRSQRALSDEEQRSLLSEIQEELTCTIVCTSFNTEEKPIDKEAFLAHLKKIAKGETKRSARMLLHGTCYKGVERVQNALSVYVEHGYPIMDYTPTGEHGLFTDDLRIWSRIDDIFDQEERIAELSSFTIVYEIGKS